MRLHTLKKPVQPHKQVGKCSETNRIRAANIKIGFSSVRNQRRCPLLRADMISPRPAQSPRFRTQILYAVFSSPIFIGQRIDLISLLANLHLTETMPLPSGAGTDLDPCRSEDVH